MFLNLRYFIFGSLFVFSNAFGGKAEVVKIVDGDTIDVVSSNGKIRVRFDCIDTPESVMYGNQKAEIVNGINYGSLATQHLMTIIKVGDIVNLQCFKTIQDGRSLCKVSKNGVDVNYQMLYNGYAFFPEKYCENQSYKYAFKIAKENQHGLHKYGRLRDPQIFRNCVKANLKRDCNKGYY